MLRWLMTVLCLCVAHAANAHAHWTSTGSGTGGGVVATMPTGTQPSGSVTGREVTLSWSQSHFAGSPLGSVPGGGYRLQRFAAGHSSGATPSAPCAATLAGGDSTIDCTEPAVPYGRWQYAVTPVLGSFTGTQGPKSDVISVVPPSPSLTAVIAQNPATGAHSGPIGLEWSAVTGATGYNVYRRAGSGAYDFSSPLNGATPVPDTTYSDATATGGTTYTYVVRAVAGPAPVESASSGELSATAITRPPPPSGTPTAVAGPGARIDVAWSSVAASTGYNVYRRTATGDFNYDAPLNGGTPATSTSFADVSAVEGTTYRYTVRSVTTGAGGTQVESTSSIESGAATADATAPPAPSSLSVSTTPLLTTATCGFPAMTRFVNKAGQAAVTVVAGINTAEAGQTVRFTASTPGSPPVTSTVAAAGTSVTATLDLTSLLDGTLTITAQSRDTAGNASSTKAPTDSLVKDVLGGALSGLAYRDNALAADSISGTSECGAKITAVETAGPNVGKTFPTSGTFTVGAGGTFSGFTVEASTLRAYGYNVTATDLAGNAGASVPISGSSLL